MTQVKEPLSNERISEHTALTKNLGHENPGIERGTDPFEKVGDVLWRMSENLQPLLHSLVPFWEVEERDCPQFAFKEKAEFDGFRMGL